jgi:carbamate kinase
VLLFAEMQMLSLVVGDGYVVVVGGGDGVVVVVDGDGRLLEKIHCSTFEVFY